MDLRRKKAERVHCAVAEAKHIQVYKAQDFGNIFDGHDQVVLPDGTFETQSNTHAGAELLRQVGCWLALPGKIIYG